MNFGIFTLRFFFFHYNVAFLKEKYEKICDFYGCDLHFFKWL